MGSEGEVYFASASMSFMKEGIEMILIELFLLARIFYIRLVRLIVDHTLYYEPCMTRKLFT